MSVPLLWMVDGTTPSGVQPRYLLMDWTGRRVATLSMWGQVQPSPDGSRALVDGTTIIDATGKRLGTVAIPGLPTYDVAWADDSRHVCAVGESQTAPFSSSVWLLGVGEAPSKMVDFSGGFDTAGPICSVAGNRAGVISMERIHYPPPQGQPYEVTTQVKVLDLTTKQTLYAHDYSPGPLPSTLIAVSASADGRYLAEEDILGQKTTVKDLLTGRTVTTFPSAWLVSFSPDDQRVAIHVVSGNLDETRVVDLGTGKILWKGQGSLGVLFGPGSAFLVRSDDPAGDYDVLLVPASGSPRVIARQVFVSW